MSETEETGETGVATEGAPVDKKRITLRKLISQNGWYFIFNSNASGLQKILGAEPYAVFLLVFILSLVSIIISFAKGTNSSHMISIMWIIAAVYVLISTATGSYYSEGKSEETEE